MNINAIVFVYRHRATGHIRTRFIDDPEPGEGWVHIETLNPALWIAAHFDDTDLERKECARTVEEMTGGEREKATLRAAAEAIRARGNHVGAA